MCNYTKMGFSRMRGTSIEDKICWKILEIGKKKEEEKLGIHILYKKQNKTKTNKQKQKKWFTCFGISKRKMWTKT